MVNSPMTMAKVRKAPESTATRMLGRMIAVMMRGVSAPMIWAASVRVLMSMARMPVSTARYM
ncbi:hypothetical protein D9M72_596860 [compost metagenome]